MLKELKRQVDDMLGEGEKEAVITVPAYFTDEQRRATKEAGELAGFVVERIINEPTAAALAFGLEHLEEDRHLLVYDLGGGTFDVSVVEMMSGIMEVKASTGNRQLGGEDFDWRLVDWFAERMIEQSGADPRRDIRAKALLKEEAERVKKELSYHHSVEVSLPLVTVKENQPVGLHITVHREQFVPLIDDLLKETMESVDRVLKDAELTASDIQEVLLVGGSTRIPRVRELVQAYFGKAPRQDVNPDEAVALGAAVQAGLKSGALSDSGLIATDVAPFSMGIAVLKETRGFSLRPGGFAAVIPRNTTVPVTKKERFYTAAPGQTSVSIEIYQGEHEWVKNNHRLGDFLLEGIPYNASSQEAIDVTFRYNLNGILEVTAQCASTGQEVSVTVQSALDRGSQEAYEDSVSRLNELWNKGSSIEGFDPEDGDEETDWELLDSMLEEELDGFDEMNDREEEDSSSSVLHEEALKLRERAEAIVAKLDEEKRRKLLEMIRELEEATQGDDLEKLEETIDKTTDLLIDLEL